MTFKVKDGLSVGANTVIDGSGNITTPANAKATLANGSTTAALNLGTGSVDPSGLVTGDVWNNNGVLKIRQSGSVTKTVAFLDSTITGNAANVTGTVATGNGGTGITTTPPAGAIAYGTGSAFAFTAAGTSGQYLTSTGTGAPSWVALPTTIANANNVAITDTSVAGTHYLHFGALTTGNDAVKVSSTKLTFVPSTGNLATTGSVRSGSDGVIISGSTSGTSTIKATDGATATFTFPTTSGNIVTTGDSGTVTSTMIADGTITNTDINASAAIAVSKLAASTISGVTLGNNLSSLTLGTGLIGTFYNGSAAVTTGLATIAGLTAATYGSATQIPVIGVDTTGRIISASTSTITIGAGTLTTEASTAGSTNTTVALSLDVAFNANSTANSKIKSVVGPSITALATIMAAAPNGILSKTGVDTYGIATNAPTATTLATARTINTVSFNGSADIIVSTGGTGVTVTGTSIAIGQAVGTSSNVQFQAIGVGQAAGTVGTITATSFNSITGLSLTATAPLVAGTATGGTATLVSREDHVHPVQTTVSGNAGSVTNGVYTNATNTLTGANAFNGTTVIHTFGNVNGLYTGHIQLGGRSIRKLTAGNAIELVDAAGTTTTHTFGDAGTLAVTGAITGSSFNSITGLSSTNPVVAGTADIGLATTAARADHVHPVQTTVSGNAGSVTNGVYTTATNTFTGTNAFNGTTIHTFGNVSGSYTGYFQLGGRGFRKLTTGSSIEIINAANTTVTHTLTDAGDFTAAGNVTAYSDIRLKKDLVQIPNALDKVQKLTGYTYTRTDSGQRQTGLIAQDVQKVLPEAVVDGEHLSLAYGNLVGLLVEAIKELNYKVDSLEAELKRK